MLSLQSFSRRAVGALLLAAVAASTVSTSGASAASPEEIKGRGKLLVGVLTDYPPFGGTDAQQQPAGYDADVAKLMAQSLGVRA